MVDQPLHFTPPPPPRTPGQPSERLIIVSGLSGAGKTVALRTRGAPGEAIVLPQVSHNLKLVATPGDPGLAGPLAPAAADALVKWLVPALGA